jgi:putative hydroxymethylpyrimidine transport system ATP-binding protein
MSACNVLASNLTKQNEYLVTASLKYEASQSYIYQDIELRLPLNQVTCLLGQSGCGKSSLLKHLVGLHKNACVNDLLIQTSVHSSLDVKGFQHELAYMAQQDLLLPWLSVIDNVLLAYDLKRPILKKKSQFNQVLKSRAQEILEQVGLPDKADKKVFTLSGGMRQRVALARTLIQDKSIILMDEPFSSVDAITRDKLQQLSSHLFKNKTVLLVTHDPLEALVMGHNILHFSNKTQKETTLKTLEPMPLPNSLPPRNIGNEVSGYHGQLMQIMQARQ